MDQQMTTFLGGCRVLDLTDETGHLCGKLLGDLGADVIKIEPPGGDPGRCTGPFYKDIPHPEKSLSWFFTALNKRSITLNLETVDGREIFKRLAKTAHFVIESFPPGYMEQLGLGYADLEATNPSLVMTSITAFGGAGPYARYRATDLVGVAMGGMVRLYGELDRPPNRISSPQFYYLGSIHGALGSMMAHYHREMTGEGQHVDVSCQQAVVLTLMIAAEIWDILKVNYRGMGPGAMSPRPSPPGPLYGRLMWPCKDGHVLCLLGGGGQLGMVKSSSALVKMASAEGYALELRDYDWSTYDASKITQEERDHLEALLGEYIRTKTKAELLDAAVQKEILIIPVTDAKDVTESDQLAARQFWVTVAHSELGDAITYPGWPVKWTGLPPYRPQRRAPLIGEHNREIYEAELGITSQQLAFLAARGAI